MIGPRQEDGSSAPSPGRDLPAPPPGGVLHRLVSLAARQFGTSAAGLSFTDEDGSWTGARVGSALRDAGRDDSFGPQVLLADGVVVARDARHDPRFVDGRLVALAPDVGFYAGAPLRPPGGAVIGALYVHDPEPRERPTDSELEMLADLAAAASDVVVLQRTVARGIEEQKLRFHLAAIVDSSDDAITSTTLEGTVSSWNRGAEALYGYSSEEMVGNHFSVLIPPERPGEAAEIMARVRDGQPVRHLQTVRLAKDGTPVPVSLTVSPIKDVDGVVLGASTIARNTSERRAAEALKAAHERATEASRLKSQFLATMSHEIRTPMNGVIGMTGLLLDSDLDPEQREYAETVRRSGEALLQIINDILDFSKIEAGKLDLETIDFDLCTVVEEVTDLLVDKARSKGVELTAFVHPEVPTGLRGDPGRVRQVLTNLVGNAVKFTDAGEVAVRASLAEVAGPEVVVRFDVSDTGIGIAPDVAAGLFLPFAQGDASTTRSYGGTGLGLAISKQLVEMMGGDIRLESEAGRGSTFSFTVRLLRQVAGPPAARRRGRRVDGGTGPVQPLVTRHTVSEDRARQRPRVLVADDNAVNQTLALAMLAKLGYSADAVANGVEAVEALSRAEYGAVLMDCQMPEMDGYEATEEIRRREAPTHRVPIIAMTAAAMKGDRERCLDAGMDDYVTKPVKLDVLEESMRRWVGDTGRHAAGTYEEEQS